jgi:DNA adenine methylase Dam
MIKSPFNYNGTKQNSLDFLFQYFDTSKDKFIDLFCGGGSVGIEALKHYKYVVMNDKMVPLINFYNELKNTPIDTILAKLEAIKLDKEDKAGYQNFRSLFNQGGATDPYQFYMLCCCCNSNMVRFNQQKLFNQTWGNRTFNDSLKSKLKEYAKVIYNNPNLTFLNLSFEAVPLDQNSFIYLDPPYIQTEAGYNCLWSKELEEALYDYIDKLNLSGYHFAMSNTLYHHGELNWAYDKFKKYNIIKVPEFHNKLRKQDYDKKSEEILITNY